MAKLIVLMEGYLGFEMNGLFNMKVREATKKTMIKIQAHIRDINHTTHNPLVTVIPAFVRQIYIAISPNDLS